MAGQEEPANISPNATAEPTGSRATWAAPRPNNSPLISIGVPVYNGAGHLGQALDALLAQTYGKFEIIISDNASTDDTPTICRRYVQADERIRYLRQPRNIGAPRNWSFTVGEARGEYFKWASANDYCCTHFLEYCLAALQSDPRIVLSFGRTQLVDDEGGSTDYEEDVEALDQRPRDRLRRICRSLRLNNAQSGLIRLDVLRKTGLDRPYQGGDIVLMSELALYGRFQRVQDAVFFRRIGSSSLSARLSAADLSHFIDPAMQSATLFEAWRPHLDLVASILNAPIGMQEQLACLTIVAHNAYWDKSRLSRELGRFVLNGVRFRRYQRRA